jgi:hypothetical protein
VGNAIITFIAVLVGAAASVAGRRLTYAELIGRA